MDARFSGYCDELAEVLCGALGDGLVGVYLHGSAVLGDFSPRRSDVDVIAVSTRPLSDDAKERVRDAVKAPPVEVARELEFSLVARDTLAAIAEAPPFELHLTADARGGGRVVDGRGRQGDPDLVPHYAVCRSHAVALLGPPAREVFPEVPRELLLVAARRELDWALANATPSYQVLNAARAWRMVEEGVVCSKTDAAEWARARVADAAVLDAALRHRREMSDEQPDTGRAAAFVEEAKARLRRG
jgi:Domain of unknown function (DUF4111)/Nucleotidyltransferase domain